MLYKLYSAQIKKFIQQIVVGKKTAFDMERFVAAIKPGKAADEVKHLGIFGAAAPEWLTDAAAEMSLLPVKNYTCSSDERTFGNVGERGDNIPVIDWYAGQLLAQAPCMRMGDVDAGSVGRENGDISGIIYHTIKFCGFCDPEYADMDAKVPVMKLETDYSKTSGGQAAIRLRAFMEANGWLKGDGGESGAAETAAGAETAQVRGEAAEGNKKSYFAGVDSGYTSTNVVILDGNGDTVAMASVPTAGKVDQSAKKALGAALMRRG